MTTVARDRLSAIATIEVRSGLEDAVCTTRDAAEVLVQWFEESGISGTAPEGDGMVKLSLTHEQVAALSHMIYDMKRRGDLLSQVFYALANSKPANFPTLEQEALS